MKYEDDIRKSYGRENRGNTPFGEFGRFRKKADPHEESKVQKTPLKIRFRPWECFFFRFLMLSSSFWPDSRPISPNLGCFRAVFLFLGVCVQFFVLQKFHFFVHLRYVGDCSRSEDTNTRPGRPQPDSSRKVLPEDGVHVKIRAE